MFWVPFDLKLLPFTENVLVLLKFSFRIGFFEFRVSA
jgi:hypothetical protein